MNELIRIEHGEVYADSRMIAEHFSKRHDNVIRDIQDEVKKLGIEGELIFEESYYTNEQNKKMPCYTMNEEGLMQLAARYDALSRRKLILKIKELKSQHGPKTAAEVTLMMAQQMVEQEKLLKQVSIRVEVLTDTIIYKPDEWRKGVNTMMAAICKAENDYSTPKVKSYELLERRAGVNLKQRLSNQRSRMADNGYSQSKIENINNLDVIEQDKKLAEIYLTIVKEMHIQHCC